MQKYKSSLSAADAALAKAMLNRGDRQSDIATYFRTNPGRISEINTGYRFAEISPASPDKLPPSDPNDTRWH